MILSHSRRFIFVHIHKAGGTSVERALDPYLSWNDLILGGSDYGESIQGAYQKRFGLNKHSAVSEIEAVCGRRYLDEYFAFALVRHPVARICSLYNFVATALDRAAQRYRIPLADLAGSITPKMKKQTPSLKWPSSRVFLQSASFGEFVRHAGIGTAPGFRTQVSCLSRQDGSLMGNCFRLEDHPGWLGTVGRAIDVDFVLPHANRSDVRLARPETLSAEDRRFIEERYREDFRAFGY